MLREGDPADYIVVDNLQTFDVLQTVINGEVVAEDGQSNIPDLRSEHVNKFACSPKQPEDFSIYFPALLPIVISVVRMTESTGLIRVIEALDGQLITNELHLAPKLEGTACAGH